MLKKRTFSLGMSAILAGLACTPAGWSAGSGFATPSAVLTVESSNIGATTTLGGTVVPYKEVAFTAQMPGRVVYLGGVEGDWFKKGDILAALDNDDLLAKRRSAQAALAQAEANWRNARVQYTRQVYSGSTMASDNNGMAMPRMFDRMFTMPMSDMAGNDNPELARRAQIYAQGTAIDQAQHGLAQAQAAIQELDAKLRDTRSVAPFAGVIINKSVEKGDTVQPGMPLLTYADTRTLQIKVDIPARLVPGIKKDMILPAKVDVGDARIETRVAQVYPMADPQRHTVTVKLDLPKDAPAGPGMYAEIMIPDITTPIKSMPVIQKSAVLWRGSLPAVMVVGSNKEPELRMIRLGGMVDDKTVSVLSGLQVGEQILANPAQSTSAVGWREQGGPEAKGVNR